MEIIGLLIPILLLIIFYIFTQIFLHESSRSLLKVNGIIIPEKMEDILTTEEILHFICFYTEFVKNDTNIIKEKVQKDINKLSINDIKTLKMISILKK